MGRPSRGGCLCRAVRFEVDEFLPEVAHCHCSMCRKFSGAGHSTMASVPRSGFRWLEGEDALKSYTAENGSVRTFCRHCGSSLTFTGKRTRPDVIELALGAVDGNVPVKPSAHIFVGSRASWTTSNDGLPRFEEGRGSARMDE